MYLHPPAFFRIAAALVALAYGHAFARDESALPSRVQVAWAPVETLSEVKDNPLRRGGWLRPEDWMKDLGDYLRVRADLALPAGQQLQVTIDDIKLAGQFEPWRDPGTQDIRFLNDLTPPRIDLHYTMTTADGATLREGQGKLRDLAYLQRTVPTTTDPLRYDKRLIDDWLRKEFPRRQ